MNMWRLGFGRNLLLTYILCLIVAIFPVAAHSSSSSGPSGPTGGTGGQQSAGLSAATSSASEGAVATAVYEPSVTDSIYIESASGQRKLINIVDAQGAGNYLAVLTSRFGTQTNNTSKYNVAVQVDAQFKVTRIANKAPAPGRSPTWQDSPDLSIPENGFVLLAADSDYATKGFKKFAAEQFEVGDTVKLLVNGQSVSMEAFIAYTESIAEPSVLLLDQDYMFTVANDASTAPLSGKLTNYHSDSGYRLTINGKPVTIQADGSFAEQLALQPMTNYFEVDLYRGSSLRKKTLVTVYRYMNLHNEREVYLWIEQSTNLNKYPTSESIRKLLVKAKAAGVTAVAFPAKGSEGFGAYLKNDLSGMPHMSQLTEPIKAGVPADLDVLQEFVRHGHELGLRIDAVFNLYGAGSSRDTGLTKEQFAAFEEWVYRPEDKGAIVPISKSNYKPPVYFMNPANDANQQYQLNVIEEVMRHYDVDGIVLDRARYDNIYADFSDISKQKFEAYLAKKGKTLVQWPQDIFEHQYDAEGSYVKTVNGPLYFDWLTYRSAGEKEMFVKFRAKIDEVNQSTGKRIPFAISMGAWYTSYYEVGQNWANPAFVYDPRLGFPLGSQLYTEEYARTGFGTKDIFDYMILGTYYNTPAAVKRGITLIHVLTREEFPTYTGFQLEQLPHPEDQRESFQAALTYTNGLKLFDLSQINWDIQKAALDNKTYVKPFQLGISIPDGLTLPEALRPHIAKGFIEADFHNQNRAVGTTGVYTDDFGQTTGTSGSYGVEVIVGADGSVLEVVNKQQAMEWKWIGNKINNSTIPRGGFVISALDKDGVRTLRQLLANSFSVNDEIRAAMLRGHLDYDKLATKQSALVLEGSVEVLGPGTAVLLINGEAVALTDGLYAYPVTLAPGASTFRMEVRVDGKKTNEVSFEVTYTPETEPPTGPETPQPETPEPGTPEPGTPQPESPEPEEPSDDPSDSGLPFAPPAPSVPPAGTTAPSPGSSSSGPSANGAADVGTVTTGTHPDGRTAMTLTVEAEKLAKAAELMAAHPAGSRFIALQLDGTAEIAEAVIPGAAIAKLAVSLPDAVLALSTGQAEFLLPVQLLDVNKLAAELDTSADQLTVHLTAERVTGSAWSAMRGQLTAGGLTPVSDAYRFAVNVQAGNDSREVASFSQYASSKIVAPGTLLPAAATAIAYRADTGQWSFVPARFAARKGQTEATLLHNQGGVYVIVAGTKTFADLAEHWARADIELLASKLLVQGVDDNRFAPEAKLKRAEFAALLVRALGLAERPAGASAFADIASSDWHAGAIGAAVQAGLVTGFEDRTFRPDAAISRQEVAVMLARALELAGRPLPSGDAAHTLSVFSDSERIAGWAQSAAAGLVRAGIIDGVADGRFAPEDDITRAQAAVMLKRVLQTGELID